ncbi:hypothetical protein ABZ990_10370 [Streptomyces sp. NPDC046203]|uniref:hypothetical protein n=1 Tax=Streptomyces sp. NPDC046203 TaxID=3154602 RepID=UPI00340F874F
MPTKLPIALAIVWFSVIAVWGGIAAPSWVMPGKYQLGSASEVAETAWMMAIVLLIIGWFLPRAAGAWLIGFIIGGVVAAILAAIGGRGSLFPGLVVAILTAAGVLAICVYRWTRKAAQAGLHPWKLSPRIGMGNGQAAETGRRTDRYAARWPATKGLRGTRIPYVALVRPRMHVSRMLDVAWLSEGGYEQVQQMATLMQRAHFALEEGGMLEIAGRDVLPCMELLHLRLRQAPDPIGIAEGKRLTYEAAVGWSVAQIERQWPDFKEGQTHPSIHNALVMYYSDSEDTEYRDSLVLAVEVGYYAARVNVNRPHGEHPQQILSELYAR